VILGLLVVALWTLMVFCLLAFAGRSYRRGEKHGYQAAHVDFARQAKAVGEWATALELTQQALGIAPEEVRKLTDEIRRQRAAGSRQ
jgi:hypothetical protein